MIVCVCNRLNERQCQRAACLPEVRSGRCIHRALGVPTRCGRCLEVLDRLVSDSRIAPAPPNDAGHRLPAQI